MTVPTKRGAPPAKTCAPRLAPSVTNDVGKDRAIEIVGQFPVATALVVHKHGPRFDAHIARELIKLIAGSCWDGKNEMIGRVFQAVLDFNPASRITFRRIRSFWHREAAGVRYHEMAELAGAAQAAIRARREVANDATER